MTILILITKDGIQRKELGSLDQAQRMIDQTRPRGFRIFETGGRRKKPKIDKEERYDKKRWRNEE